MKYVELVYRLFCPEGGSLSRTFTCPIYLCIKLQVITSHTGQCVMWVPDPPFVSSHHCLNLLDSQTSQILRSYLKMQCVIEEQASQSANLIVFMLWLTDTWSQARMKHPH